MGSNVDGTTWWLAAIPAIELWLAALALVIRDRRRDEPPTTSIVWLLVGFSYCSVPVPIGPVVFLIARAQRRRRARLTRDDLERHPTYLV